MPRTRLIRPEFFADEDMARLSIATRLVYVGLWTLADDAGWFDRKPRTIAAALFPFDPGEDRDGRVATALLDLEDALRIRWADCGKHGEIPTLPRHIQKGGTHAFTFRDRHRATCALLTAIRPSGDHSSGPVHTRRDKSLSDSGSVSWSDSESDGAPRGLKARYGTFADVVAAGARMAADGRATSS